METLAEVASQECLFDSLNLGLHGDIASYLIGYIIIIQ
jgi:hypothetical protein